MAGLSAIGAEAHIGLVASFANVREITPLIAGVALATKIGAGFTAEIGAMRISEEVAALEVIGVRPIPYLVSTRVWAALIPVVPLHLFALFMSFIATRVIATGFYTISPGAYDARFDLFLPVIDIVFSMAKAIVFTIDYPLEAFGDPPFLAEGDVVVAEDGVTEVEDVLQELQPLLAGIDEGDLATLFDAVASLEGEGDTIARNFEVSAELARFGSSISDDALRNARLLTSLTDQLATGADEFDRLNRALPGSVAILSERQQEITTNLYVPFKIFLDIEVLARDHLGPLFDPLTSTGAAGRS